MLRAVFALGGIWAAINGIVYITGIIGICALILGGWFRLFKLCGHPHPWAAFVPIYNWIVMCDCCGTDEVDLIGNVTIPMKLLKWGWIPLCVILFIIPAIILPLIVFLLFITGWMYMMIFSNIKETDPKDEMVMAYLCVTNPILLLVMMYKIEPAEYE